MASFRLKLISCDRSFYDGECDKLIIPVFDGNMEILAHHEQMLAQVCVGELRFAPPGSDWKTVVISSGIVSVEDNIVKVIVYSANSPEEIDAEAARRAKEKAEEELQAKLSDVNRQIAEDALQLATQQLHTIGRL